MGSAGTAVGARDTYRSISVLLSALPYAFVAASCGLAVPGVIGAGEAWPFAFITGAVCLALAGVVVRIVLMRVVADPSGITSTGCLTTTVIPWSQVAGLRLVSGPLRGRCVGVDTIDGRLLFLNGLTYVAGYYPTPRALTGLRQWRDEYGPAAQTPT